VIKKNLYINRILSFDVVFLLLLFYPSFKHYYSHFDHSLPNQTIKFKKNATFPENLIIISNLNKIKFDLSLIF